MPDAVSAFSQHLFELSLPNYLVLTRLCSRKRKQKQSLPPVGDFCRLHPVCSDCWLRSALGGVAHSEWPVGQVQHCSHSTWHNVSQMTVFTLSNLQIDVS